MKNLLKTFLIVLLASGIMLVGCKKEEESKVEDNGLTKAINDFIPESTLNEMKTLGMPINTGGSPPSIENIYYASPFILKASNRYGDIIGYAFSNYKVKFYEQNNDDLEIKVDYVNGPESGTGIGGFVVGNDNHFTVFSGVTSTIGNEEATLIHVISGKLTADGIEDLHFANFMLDNHGNPNGTWLEEGEGRIIYDSDGMSEIVNSLKSGTTNTGSKITVSGVEKR